MRGLLICLFALTGAALRWQQEQARLIAAKRPIFAEHDRTLFHALLRNCTDIVWFKDIDGVYQLCSQAAAAALGLSPDLVVGKTDAQLFAWDVALKHAEVDRKVVASGDRHVEEQVISNTDGSQIRVVEMIKSPVALSDGTIVGVLGIARDITVRRTQERKIREQEALLLEMSTLAQVGGWEIDVVADTFRWTPETALIHELDPALPLTLERLLADYDEVERKRIESALAQTFETGTPNDLDLELNLPSGAHKCVRAHWRTAMTDGKVTRVWGMAQDVTERRKLDESMRMAELIYNTTPDAILVTDDQGHVVDANPAFMRLVGHAREDVIGMLPRQLLANPDETRLLEAITHALNEDGHWEGEIRLRHKDQSYIDAYLDIDIMRDKSGNQSRRAIHIRDLTDQKNKDELIWKHANFDRLTGLPNRSLSFDRLEQELKKARSDDGCVGVMCIDLDRFTGINDMLGHDQGDAVLIETAARLRACVLETATLGRLGGDSFAVIVAGPRAHLELNAAAIVDALARPFDAGTDRIHLSASIGITLYPDDAQDAHGLMNGAEQAMVRAKRAGGNRFQYFAAALQQSALAKLRLSRDLRHAIAGNELVMHYQPIVDMRTGRIRKAEALIRWLPPTHGLIGPAQFIPLAEESGLIVQIGNWVIDEAIASVARWQRELGIDIELSVNQSPVQFEHGGDVSWIKRLAQAALPAHSITVEITESMLVNDSDRMRTNLKLLQENGAKVSLDDFGTGFSALSYLKLFDVDYLKIDKSFIHHLEANENDKALTQAIIDMAHKLHIETIAEGVETTAQRDILTAFGCDYLQGYLYSPPAAREVFEQLLEHQHT